MNDPEAYATQTHCPNACIRRFFERVFGELWTPEDESEWTMDIGCGPGKRSLKQFLPCFASSSRFLCIDVSPEMVDYACTYYAHPRIQYHVADIETWSSLSRWKGQISRAVSVYCFNWLRDQRQGFQNMFDLLRPGGEAAITWALTMPFWDAVQELGTGPKWNKYVRDIFFCIPESHFNQYSADHYTDLLSRVGFQVLYSKTERIAEEFSSDQNCRDFFASICALVPHIPAAERAAFKEDLLQKVLVHSGRSARGLALYDCTIAEMVVRKPNFGEGSA